MDDACRVEKYKTSFLQWFKQAILKFSDTCSIQFIELSTDFVYQGQEV